HELFSWLLVPPMFTLRAATLLLGPPGTLKSCFSVLGTYCTSSHSEVQEHAPSDCEMRDGLRRCGVRVLALGDRSILYQHTFDSRRHGLIVRGQPLDVRGSRRGIDSALCELLKRGE